MPSKCSCCIYHSIYPRLSSLPAWKRMENFGNLQLKRSMRPVGCGLRWFRCNLPPYTRAKSILSIRQDVWSKCHKSSGIQCNGQLQRDGEGLACWILHLIQFDILYKLHFWIRDAPCDVRQLISTNTVDLFHCLTPVAHGAVSEERKSVTLVIHHFSSSHHQVEVGFDLNKYRTDGCGNLAPKNVSLKDIKSRHFQPTWMRMKNHF